MGDDALRKTIPICLKTVSVQEKPGPQDSEHFKNHTLDCPWANHTGYELDSSSATATLRERITINKRSQRTPLSKHY